VGRDPSFLPITMFGIQQSDRVTSISEYLRRATLDTFCCHCRVDVIYNFIDADLYSRAPEPGFLKEIAPNGEKVMVHISTFRPVKRITDCIEVLARVRELDGVRLKLVMCGDGPERRDAEALAEQLGVAGDVLFVGQKPQLWIRQCLSVADALLLPSQSESFGLVALEAMACQVPVIATRVGGLPEVVVEGETGYLFEVGDVDGMAQGVLRVLKDNDLRDQLGERGRKVAVSRFSSNKIIPQYEALYKEVLSDFPE
ncbi:MAG: N-acetyl-alpha-D-glucosaminyl L-malate synthase BshA, partial [Blastocatellia bacterium]